MDDLLIEAMKSHDSIKVFTLMRGTVDDLTNVAAVAAEEGYWSVLIDLLYDRATWLEIYAMDNQLTTIASKRLLYFAIVKENIDMIQANSSIDSDIAIISLGLNRNSGTVFQQLVNDGKIVPEKYMILYAIHNNLSEIVEKLAYSGILPDNLDIAIEKSDDRIIRVLVESGVKPSLENIQYAKNEGMYKLAEYLRENL